MTKSAAIELVQTYFNKENKKKTTKVLLYSNPLKRKIIWAFNYLKYKYKFYSLGKIKLENYVKPDLLSAEKWVINKKNIFQTEQFWVVYWGTEKFITELDINYGIIGAGPILVSKKDGRLFQTDSTLKIKKYSIFDLDKLREIEIK